MAEGYRQHIGDSNEGEVAGESEETEGYCRPAGTCGRNWEMGNVDLVTLGENARYPSGEGVLLVINRDISWNNGVLGKAAMLAGEKTVGALH